MPPDPVALLREHFGYPGFRPGQEELVRAAIAGRDALGILPTGGGKSVCYQIPALALGGLTLVITPLVSLMEDQVQRARRCGLRAAHLSAAQAVEEKRATLERARTGELDMLFVAPERLELDAFLDVVATADVRLLAVDESHCISEWGEAFRPSYRRIGRIRQRISVPVLALTATATPRVREDVASNLRLHDPLVVVRSFDRPNLAWAVLAAGSLRSRVRRLHSLLRRIRGTAIVYAPTRKSVDDVRDALAAFGVVTEAYHAGLAGPERTRVQAAFMSGACRVVVATNAFGMGIDKSDVRFVAHMQLPGTLEAYYQEAGRAGRDGEQAWCVAFSGKGDDRLAHGFVDRSHPPLRRLERLHAALRRTSDPSGVARIPVAALARALGRWTTPEDALLAVAALQRAGAVRVLDGPEDDEAVADGAIPGGAPSASTPLRLGVRTRADLAPALALRGAALVKLAAVRRYAEARGCRRRELLAYFGEGASSRCGGCDRCVGAGPRRSEDPARVPWTDV